jgi:hypothetical protein
MEEENERLREALQIIADDKSLSFVVQQIAQQALEHDRIKKEVMWNVR